MRITKRFNTFTCCGWREWSITSLCELRDFLFSNYATEPGARNRLVGLGNSQALYRKLALSVCTSTADRACEDLCCCFFCLARKNFLSKRAWCIKQNRPGEDDKGPLSNIGLRTTKDCCQTKSAWRGRQRAAVKQNRPGEDDKGPLSNKIGLERTTKDRCQSGQHLNNFKGNM